jgi:carboxyl-terminal processing protease
MIDAGIQTRTPNAQFLTEMGLNTMMQSLDPHSSYMAVTPERLEAQQNRTGGTFSGIGVEVNLDYEIDDPDNAPENPTLKKGLNIASIIDEASPAAEAGVQDGDIITHVNDTPLAGLTISEAVELIKGPTGSDVDLTIQRGGEDQALNITVTRGPIPESPIVQAMLEGNIGYIRAKAFNAQTDRFMDEAIEELEARGAERFILDLRYNPGGLITEADHMIENFMDGDQALLDYWEQRNALAEEIRSVAGTVTAEDLPEPTAEQQAMIEENTSVNIRRRYGKAPEFYITPGVETDKPLVILMNEYSASASELVAGALQDFGRATIVGTQSFGKGSMHVSGAMDVDRDGVPDALINLTTGLYYVGPGGGRSIHGVGVTPDIRLSEEFKFVSEPRRTEAGLASSIHTPEDNNDHSISNSECRPANQEIALADMDPWLECAMAYLNGQTQTSNVTIAPLDPAAPN